MKQVVEPNTLGGENVVFLAGEILDVDNDALTYEVQSDQEILLLATQPLNKSTADADSVDREIWRKELRCPDSTTVEFRSS